MKKRNLIIFVLCLTVAVGIFLITAPLWWKLEKKEIHTVFEPGQIGEKPIRPLPERPNRKEIVFGASISRSGRFTAESQRMQEGYELWKDWVNSRGGINIGEGSYKVRIIYRDNKSSPEYVRENVRRLIEEDHVDFLLGPFSSGLTMEASKVSEKLGVIMVEGCGASETIFAHKTRCTFATLTSASWYLRGFFKMVCRLEPKPKTYAALAKDGLFSRSVAKGARIWAAKGGLEEVYFGVDRENSDNYTPYLDEIEKASPDLIVFCGHYKDSIDFTSQLVNTTGVSLEAVVMTLGPTQRDYIKDLGKAAEGMMGITQWVENTPFRCPVFGSTKIYVELFVDKFGNRPTYQNAQSSACGVVYQLALERCRSLNASQVLKEIRRLDRETFYGRIRFDSRGMNIGKEMAIVQIQGGMRRTIWPQELADASPVFPIKTKVQR